MNNSFKGLDLIDTVPEKLWMEVCDTVQEKVIKTIHKKQKHKKAKWLSEEDLQIAEKRREVKGKREQERYTYLDAEFQRIARRYQIVSKISAKKQRKIIAWERLAISSRQLEIPREHFMQSWAQ